METAIPQVSLHDLIEQADSEMLKIGYAAHSMRIYRKSWNALKQYAFENGEICLTTELGHRMLRERYDMEPFDHNLSGYQKHARRAIMLLLEYQASGGIAKVAALRPHVFPQGYREAGECFLSCIKDERDLHEHTISNYRSSLETAFNYFDSHGAADFSKVSQKLANEFIKTYAGYSKSTIYEKISVLKKFTSFAAEQGVTSVALTFPSIMPYQDKKVSEFYDANEIQQILAAVDRANPRGKRDYAMLLMGARYGLRISDIKSLRFRDIDFVSNKICIEQVKTGKPLKLDLLPDVGWALIDYIKSGRPPCEAPEIFIRHNIPYGCFERNNVCHIIEKYANKAGIQKKNRKPGFHMLRFGLASELLKQGVSLTAISGILGHSELNVTTLYTRIDHNQLRCCALEVPR